MRGSSLAQNSIMSITIRIDGRGREDPLLLRDVLLEHVVLDRCRASCSRGDALLLADRDVAREQDRAPAS